jgi:hypothetical protein
VEVEAAEMEVVGAEAAASVAAALVEMPERRS